MPSPAGQIFLRLLSQYLTDSNHLAVVHTEVDTETWNRKRRNRGDEERGRKSGGRDWALTFTIPMIFGNSTSLNPCFFICKMRGLPWVSCIRPAPKPVIAFIDSSRLCRPFHSHAVQYGSHEPHVATGYLKCSSSKLKHALRVRFRRHKMKRRRI